MPSFPETSAASQATAFPAADPNTQSIPWIEKYRPADLSQICGHEEILNTIQRFLNVGELPNLLLHGPAGTGKTTTAVAICKQIYGAAKYKMSTLELNASDERGIDVVRHKVKGFSQTVSFGALMVGANGVAGGTEGDDDAANGNSKDDDMDQDLETNPFGAFATAAEKAEKRAKKNAEKERQKEIRHLLSQTFKVVILDEADSMTQAAQFALRRMIEQFSNNVRFFIICNYAQKIIPALVSRCTGFRFSVLPEEYTGKCIMNVAEAERVRMGIEGEQPLQNNGMMVEGENQNSDNPNSLTPSGNAAVAALQHVSGGDLRKVLNLLQSIYMMKKGNLKGRKKRKVEDANGSGASSSSTVVSSDSQDHIYISANDVYSAVDWATPDEVREMVKTLLTCDTPQEAVSALLVKQPKSTDKNNTTYSSIDNQSDSNNARQIYSLLPQLHNELKKLKYPSLQDRLLVVEALKKIEYRLSQGCDNDEYEAAFLASAVMDLRSACDKRAESGAGVKA